MSDTPIYDALVHERLRAWCAARVASFTAPLWEALDRADTRLASALEEER